MGIRLTFRFEPFSDLYLLLRRESSGDAQPAVRAQSSLYAYYFQDVPSGPEWDAALDAMRRAHVSVSRQSGGPEAWAGIVYDGLMRLDGDIAACSDIDGLDRLAEGRVWLPSVLPDLREAVGRALPLYERVAEQRRRACESAIADLRGRLRSEATCMHAIFEWLGERDNEGVAEVRLVGQAPLPAYASLGRIVVADLERWFGSSLIELIFRKAFFVLRSDVVLGADGQLMGRLRGLGFPMDKIGRLRDALLCAHVAACVRRFIGRELVDVGWTDGTYRDVPNFPAIRQIWLDYLEERERGASRLLEDATTLIADAAVKR